MTGRRPARAALAALLVLVLALAGCTLDGAPHGDPPTTTAVLPTPPGASSGVPAPIGIDAQTCDADVSLRPPATMPEPGDMPRGSTMRRIADRGRLVVGTDLGSNPLSFRDPISGDIEGFDVDVAHWISDAIFGESRIEYRILSTGDRIRALQNGEVDIVVKSMSITCERLDQVAFSSPYYSASQRILTYRGSGIRDAQSLNGKTACATGGATAITRLLKRAPEAHIVTTNNWSDCLVMLQQDQVDAIAGDDPILAGIAAQDPQVQVVGESLGYENYGVGIPLGQNDLVRFINGVLAERIADGSWQSSYNRWLSVLGPGYPPTIRYRD
ncbi:glutamate ABC transporter substrate-binding protein [Gordonia sp. VNK21]|uniref:glutamate ABC transporter substrate-binding protein n=1 Tax=Gordonia sp. VNK21 TaxID=3382483 RepID=UPI0038D371A8